MSTKDQRLAAADAVRALMRMDVDEDDAVYAMEYAAQNEGVQISEEEIRDALTLGNPEPRGEYPPALIRAIAGLLNEVNRADNRRPGRLGMDLDEARRVLCRELGLSRTDTWAPAGARSLIEERLRAALAGQVTPGQQHDAWRGS